MTFTELAVRYRSIGKPKKVTFIFCADHGVSEMNVSAYPKSTTASMVKNYLVAQGGAANAFANFTRSELVVVDVGVDADISKIPGLVDRKIARGTKNFTKGAAMTLAQAKKSIQVGKDLANKAIQAGCNCFLIGEMGISNTTAAAAITSTFLRLHPRKVTGRGSNISDDRLKNKIKIVKQALEVNKPNPDDALDVLAKVGGFEFGAMAGVILAAARKNCVVILDGFNSTAAALIADAINPDVTKKLIASSVSREIGHTRALDFLSVYPIFNLDLALGEAIASSITSKSLDSIVYTYVCDPDDDFDGDIEELKDDDTDGAEIISNLLEKVGLPDVPDFDNLNDIEDYIEDTFGESIQIEEVDLDFQLSNESRLESFTPPFSAQDFNVPRSYPMLVRVMGGENDESVAATDKTFNFYLETMPKLHAKAMNACKEYIDHLTKPLGSLGVLEEIAIQFAGIANENIPANKLRHAAFALTGSENRPNFPHDSYQPFLIPGQRRNVSMDFSLTARTFGAKLFLGVIDENADPTVAFNFGRNLAEEITFSIPIIAITDLSDWRIDKMEERFAITLLDDEGELKVAPEEFLNHVPKQFRNLTSALIGAIVAAAHNSTLVVIDCGVVEIIARYLEKICPEIKPYLLYAGKLLNVKLTPELKIGLDGEVACMGVEIVEAALTALNEMKTFSETDVEIAVDGKGAKLQKGN